MDPHPDFSDLLAAFVAADVRVTNQRASGRPQDIADALMLEAVRDRKR